MKVSVVIPTYNYANYIVGAIESVFNQDYKGELELIIIDDGSTDNTEEIVAAYSKRLKYFRQQNAGKAAATQKGIEMATGDIIFNLDADDYFLPGKIRKTAALFKADVSLIHVGSPALIRWTDGSQPDKREPVPEYLQGRRLYGQKTLRWYFENKLLYGGGSTFAARAWALKQMRWHPDIDMYTDEWLLIEMLMKSDSYLLPEPLSVWQVHGNNYSVAANKETQALKNKRLEKSSLAILQMLERYDYPDWLVKAYRLKHEVRKMIWLEEQGEKHFGDSLRYVKRGIFSGNSLPVLMKYKAFNRLVPGWAMRRLSAFRKLSSASCD